MTGGAETGLLHVVLLALRQPIEARAMARMDAALRGLADQIPGITSYTSGPNASPEGLGGGFEFAFIMRFVDAAARDAYLPHPAHQAVVPLVQAVAETVVVFDLPA